MSVTERPCSRCGGEVLEVLTAEGFEVLLDPAELDPLGELGVVLGGRWTYTRHTWAEQVHMRGAPVIRARPAGTRARQVVHPPHECTPTPNPTPTPDPTARSEPR